MSKFQPNKSSRPKPLTIVSALMATIHPKNSPMAMQNNRNSKESPNYPLASNLSKKETTKTIKSTTKRKSKDADKKRKRKEDMRRSITKKNRKKTKIHLTIKILGIKSSPSKSLNSKNLSQKKPLLLIQYTMQTKLIEIPVWLTIQAKADNMKSPG